MPRYESTIVNAFTVDVEDYYHVSSCEHVVRRDQWDTFERRVEQNTARMLDLLDRFAIRATFFVLGWVAERHPNLVREIHRRGHEIGSHGYWHRLIYEQSPQAFKNDIRESKRILEEITGKPVVIYRAPSFSITSNSLWALDILVEEGFQIDSSIFPVRHDRYGVPAARKEIHAIRTAAGPLWEFPPTVTEVARFRLPLGGGGYLRLYPTGFTCRHLQQINDRQRRPFLVYVHPWEIDPEQPRITGTSRLTRFRHRVNLHKTERKIARLLESFRFGPVGEVVDECVLHDHRRRPTPVRMRMSPTTRPSPR